MVELDDRNPKDPRWIDPGSMSQGASPVRSSLFAGGCLFALIMLPVVTFSSCLLYHDNVVVPGRVAEASAWVRTPCVIRDYGETTTGVGDKTTTNFFVRYEYSFNGQTYLGDRLGLPILRSGVDLDWERKKLAQLNRGMKTNCFVNPDAPSESVLFRTRDQDAPTLSGFYFLGIGLIFAVMISAHFARRWHRYGTTPS